MPGKKFFILMCEEVKGEAQICRFYGFEFPEQEVHSIKEIIEKRSVWMLSTCTRDFLKSSFDTTL